PPARKAPEPPAVAVVQRNDEPAPQAEPAPRVASPEPAAARPAARAGGAAAALDVLRNAGMRVSSDRGRAGAAAKPAAEKPVAPRPAVQVPTPRAAARAPQAADSRQPSPPWEDIPPDDYVPLSADEMFGGSDDGFVPVFDSGPDDV
ncbi:hypothetical protein M3596_22805, partial [Bacillus subtilis]|nr:hypothetical protein [Bacillus subtilis]